ncbi:MAG: ABC transporter permease [Chloroflexi bacterium]|nr:ABC transporter permease [Chloroflexota bacterium]
MKLWILVMIAVRSLTGNPTRSLLTMLGVIIGVAAVISTVSIGTGAQADIAKRVEQLGANQLIVKGAKVKVQGVSTTTNGITLTPRDVQALGALPGVVAVVPSSNKDFHVQAGRKNTGTTIIGTVPVFAPVGNYHTVAGRFLTTADLTGYRNVAVLGQRPERKLFGGVNPVGKHITINGLTFSVIGLLGPKGVIGQNDLDDQIIIPLSLYQRMLSGGTQNAERAVVQVQSSSQLPAVTGEIDALLRQRHHITGSAKPDFKIKNQLSVLNAARSVTTSLTYLIGGLAAVSLVVGGIGIMNIMLVAVAERTREIGTRKAIGATDAALFGQFVVEATVLSVLGGCLGILGGITAARIITQLAGWRTLVAPGSILLAVAVSLAVGIFFGVYPATRAARLAPIDALRHE